MSTLTIDGKGQITLSADLLQHLGVQSGEKLTVDKLPHGQIGLRAARPTGKISDVFGTLKRPGNPVLSVEEINEIAAKGWAGEFNEDPG
jgi:hypothetical protein